MSDLFEDCFVCQFATSPRLLDLRRFAGVSLCPFEASSCRGCLATMMDPNAKLRTKLVGCFYTVGMAHWCLCKDELNTDSAPRNTHQ